MKSIYIPMFKIIRVFFIAGLLALAFARFDLARNQTLAQEEICSESELPTFIQKINDQKAVYIYGTCEGYTKIVSSQKSSEAPKKKVSVITKNHLRPAPRKLHATKRQQYMINYAWQLSRGDEKFIAMIEAESKWQPHKWEVVEKDGEFVQGNGYGLCQVDNRYWADIQSDPKFQQNWAYQVHACLKLWKSGVRFYGADKNPQMISRFWWSPQDDT
jgi:hypothetical protein